MMKHDGILIAIFLFVGLVIPALVFMRVYSTAFSGMNSSQKGTAKTADTEPAEEQQAHDQ